MDHDRPGTATLPWRVDGNRKAGPAREGEQESLAGWQAAKCRPGFAWLGLAWSKVNVHLDLPGWQYP